MRSARTYNSGLAACFGRVTLLTDELLRSRFVAL